MITIVFQGQIGVVAGLSEEKMELSPTLSIADAVVAIAKAKGVSVAKFLVDADQQVRSSLFVALDGVHQADLSQPLGEAREILLMPPMAGG